jgi:hypothetical protein
MLREECTAYAAYLIFQPFRCSGLKKNLTAIGNTASHRENSHKSLIAAPSSPFSVSLSFCFSCTRAVSCSLSIGSRRGCSSRVVHLILLSLMGDMNSETTEATKVRQTSTIFPAA